MGLRSFVLILVGLSIPGAACSQALPRISAMYPPGASAGSSVEVAIRGGGLEGAREVLVDGGGVSVRLTEATTRIDPEEQKVFSARCAQCHQLRGPATLSRTPEQWVATVDRMIRDRMAPIEAADRARIVNYLQAAARAGAGLSAKISVAADAAPGPREFRVVGANGTSTAFVFDVTRQAEGMEIEPNDSVAAAQPLEMPVILSGQLAPGDVDCFAVTARKGQRIVFECSAYRMNEASQAYFFPVLSLYDEKGQELAKNTGYFSLDPLIDWTAPADGRYVVAIRDMLYRGSPATVYRLSMGDRPYRTYVFPAGGQWGTTTDAVMNGENMRPTLLRVPLAARPTGSSSPEVVRIATPHGTALFVGGAEPEVVEQAGQPLPPVVLPASINGRIGAPRETDRYPFSLRRDQLGAYRFEAFADRIQSPLLARLVLRSARGQVLGTAEAAGLLRDPRLDYTFTEPGDFVLEVTDTAGQGSPAHIYRISAAAAQPDFLLTLSPDNPNLGPGSSVYLQVRVQRRVGVGGDIELSCANLPPGVTAGRTVIRPGQTDGFLILTAAADAAPGAFARVRVTGRTMVNGTIVSRELVPYEIYRINNNPQTVYRKSLVVTVGPEVGWTATLEPGAVELSPQGGPVRVTLRVNRRGSQGDIPFAVVGLPPGVDGPRSVLLKRGTTELTFSLNPNRQAAAPSAAGGAAPYLLALVNGREGEAMMMSTPGIPVTIGLPSAAAR